MVALPALQKSTRDLIYDAYAARQGDSRRAHLGASMIGRECERQLWYGFRWAMTISHDGRLLRLFDTGNHEEPRMVEDLRRIGMTVLEVDPENGRQWQCRDETGHFGGSADGAGIGVPEAPKTWHLLEFKTHGDKSFTTLAGKLNRPLHLGGWRVNAPGVMLAKPEHYAQMQIYMHLLGLTRALYLAKNKNTDELYSERVRYDAVAALRLVEKARRIVTAPEPPAKISADPSFFACKFCDFNKVCHEGVRPERNCRTCMHSTPIDGGQWSCAIGNDMGDGRAALPCHRFIPPLVAGEQVDVRGDSIVYKTAGGKWVDDGRD